MKTPLLSLLLLTLFGLSVHAQSDCGTMQNLERMIKEDPSLKARMEEIERQTQEWIKKNEVARPGYIDPQQVSQNGKSGNPSTLSVCGYDNTKLQDLTAPTTIGQIVNPSPNCINGGQFVTVKGLIPGNTYRISTCGTNVFNTQLTMYTAGGSQAVAHNDDYCGTQSEIYFNPILSGDYDVLVDASNCVSNTLCATLEVELVKTPRPIITIPVVFHIFHNGEALGTGRNLSQARIDSQMVMLNRDFRRLNGDIHGTPAAFRGVSDDVLVEFCLADRDVSGNATTGVTRHAGAFNYTSSSFEAQKPSTAWDRDKYLNFWTCDLYNQGAYAQFPGGPAGTDGIVVDYTVVSPVPGSVPDRTAFARHSVHEAGHWLNLRHIWADENGCGADDFVADTPQQAAKTPDATCPTFPVTDGCSPSFPGIMFNNYMDYTSAPCTRMFTRGQALRMDACLATTRASILTSGGCSSINPTGINDLDLSNSISIYPSPNNGLFSFLVSANWTDPSSGGKEKLDKINLTIVNVLGEKVFETSVSEQESNIDLRHQPNGVYFIQVTFGKGIFENVIAVKKIIINK